MTRMGPYLSVKGDTGVIEAVVDFDEDFGEVGDV